MKRFLILLGLMMIATFAIVGTIDTGQLYSISNAGAITATYVVNNDGGGRDIIWNGVAPTAIYASQCLRDATTYYANRSTVAPLRQHRVQFKLLGAPMRA